MLFSVLYFYACLKDSYFFVFLMKGSRHFKIRIKRDKWLHQFSERMICRVRIRREAESRDYED